MPKKISVEERILQTARRLFCQVGIHATGIARIIEESGVSRRSLYTHYGSKENLLKAVFEAEASIWFHWFDCDLPQMTCPPDERVLALFDLMQDWFDSEIFYGCVFINAVAEHEKCNNWIQEIANDHREKITARLVAIVVESGARDPEMVTEKLNLLIDGTIVAAMVTGNGEIAHVGKLAAADILRSSK
ncbi:TetR/AcrR family transcriptional regulator [Nitrosomonas eutropha]|uniref:TetR family transcriptional regulator n=2 Tax=Nitrosomonas eutropha TaxID=916 RepID=A0ABX5M600_9PROT|nr:TetR family transcriptional regulator [Nitrosomonas eutropha]ABI58693.1 transcriptional regulator, TetR family [Nitrosomonas eutropha C91]PXV80143.1 TetR family transcriptional regulator [Nitrosomonas eutropha]SEI41742.1 transcriptional regulator, TetR family [Nitrosomonas eutropha]